MKRHLPFQAFYVWSAILLGVFGGFGTGAHLVYFLAYGLTPGRAFAAMIQVHGHLQLIAWTGFFIIGISLFKLPRLMSTQPISPFRSYVIFGTLIVGVILRSLAQLILFYSEHEAVLRGVVAIGILLESIGIMVYFFALFKNSLTFSCKPGAYAAASIKPFLIVSLLGWFTYAAINTMVGVVFLFDDSLLLSPIWNHLAIEVYLSLVLLPTCFAFSISTFPIFLRLRAPTWPVSRIASTYALGALTYLVGLSTQAFWNDSSGNSLQSIGVCVKAASIFWLVFEMDLFRREYPWYQKYRAHQDRENRLPRRLASDYGQFGNFEWLIYASYVWLLLAAASEVVGLWSNAAPSPTIVRHFYLLGFVSHLILGMAVRMLPGFLGKNRIAYPFLVRLSFLLLLIATLGRTMPLLFSALDNKMFRFAFGFSGVTAILAICCLGLNLTATIRQSNKKLFATSFNET